jgi:hypothetical protein
VGRLSGRFGCLRVIRSRSRGWTKRAETAFLWPKRKKATKKGNQKGSWYLLQKLVNKANSGMTPYGGSQVMILRKKHLSGNNFVIAPLYNKIYVRSGRLMVEALLPFFAIVVFWIGSAFPTALCAAELKGAPNSAGEAFAAQTSSHTRTQKKEDKFDIGAAMSNKDRGLRLQAAERLRHRKAGVSADDLRKAVKGERDPLVRTRLVQAVGVSGGSNVLGDLMQTLSGDADPMVRQAAAQQLVRYPNNDAATGALAKCIDKETVPKVRYACVLSLSHSELPKAMDALEKASKDRDPAMRRQAAFVLKGRKSDRAVKILNALSKDKDGAVRESARQSGK